MRQSRGLTFASATTNMDVTIRRGGRGGCRDVTSMLIRIKFSLLSAKSLLSHLCAVVVLCVLSLSSHTASYAGDLLSRTQAGGRLGVWINTGETGAGQTPTGFTQDFSNANLYAELFMSLPLSSRFRFEGALGVSNRSDINYNRASDEFTGSANLYPLQGLLRLYPFARKELFGLCPYVSAGGGFVFGSQRVTGASSVFGTTKSAVDINYIFGAGIDIPISSNMALGAAAKYHNVYFGGDGFLGLRDYSGVDITFGLSYFIPNDTRPPHERDKHPKARR